MSALARGPIEAAVSCARRMGLVVDNTVSLRSTNNTVVLLEPAGVVAKIATGHQDRLALELVAARRLADAGAPVVGPSRLVTAEVHREAGFNLTFWPYQAQPGSSDLDGVQVATALFRLHSALREVTWPGPMTWPTLDDELGRVRNRLDDAHFALALQQEDRDLLAGAVDFGRSRLAHAGSHHQLLHGSPHRGNILVVADSPLFIDFETVCVGPVEWDLAHLEQEVTLAYSDVIDAEALQAAQLLVAATTSAWCWHDIAKGPDMSFHANLHLRSVREAMS